MKTFDMKALKNRWFGKTNKTAWFISLIISLCSILISRLFLDKPEAYLLGSVVLFIFHSLFLKKPELMGSLYNPDDGEKEEDA